jgi:hypothetical protein
VSQLVDGLAVVLCLLLVLTVLARGSAGTISAGHCRPWIRRRDLETGAAVEG